RGAAARNLGTNAEAEDLILIHEPLGVFFVALDLFGHSPGDDGRGSVMSVSILVVDDEPDVADLFRQRFRRETRQGKYVMHFAASGGEALNRLAGEIQPTL